jgi:hypothetical protein
MKNNFKCRIAINIVPFLLSVNFFRIRVVIACTACTAWLSVIGLTCLLSLLWWVFIPTLCLKYNKVPQPYLKHTGSVTKKTNFLKLHLKKFCNKPTVGDRAILMHIWIKRGKVHKKHKLVFMWQKLCLPMLQEPNSVLHLHYCILSFNYPDCQ